MLERKFFQIMYSRFVNTKRLFAETPLLKRWLSFVGTRLLRVCIGLLVVLLTFLVADSTVATAQEVLSQEIVTQEVIDPAREASVKAVFLYSYGRYVTWPEEESGMIEGDFVIGVLGDSAVTEKLRRIAKKRTIAGHPIELILVESLEQVPRCHILYVAGHADENRQKAIVEATADQPLLLVGETEGFAERGAAINFYISGNRVRFQINAETVRQRGLQLDAQLLNLGDRVGGPPEN